MKVIAIGDLHFREDEPFFSAKQLFLDWLAQQPWNNGENVALVLGDVANKPKDSGRVNGQVVHFFTNILHTSFAHVLTGNHEASYRDGNFLDLLMSLERVRVYDDIVFSTIAGHPFLLLPYIPRCYERHGKSMKDVYENIAEFLPSGSTWNEIQNTPPFIAYHFPDETQTLFGDYIDISYIPGTRIGGDIHIESEHYVGTPVINRKDERGKKSHIWIIHEDRSIEPVEVPRFLDYVEVEYGTPPPTAEEAGASIPYLIVNNAPSKAAVYENELYSEYHIHPEIGVTAKTVNTTMSETATVEGEEVDLEDYPELFRIFAKEKGIRESIATRARARLQSTMPSSVAQADGGAEEMDDESAPATAPPSPSTADSGSLDQEFDEALGG